MVFKKIDEDAAAAEEPLDGYLLQGIRQNADAVDAGRFRRTSWALAQGRTLRIGAYRAMALPLCSLELAPRVVTLRVRLRGLCDDGEVYLGLALLDPVTGQITSTATPTTLSVGDEDAVLDLDVTGRQGVAHLALVYRSEVVGAGSTKVNYASGTTTLLDAGSVALGPGFALDPSERYVLTYGDHGALASDPLAGGYPPRLELIEWDDATDETCQVWPAYYGGWFDLAFSNYSITINKLGSFNIYGVSIEERAVDARPTLSYSLEPAIPPSVRALGALHARLRELHVRRPPVHRAGPCCDQSLDADGRLISAWGVSAQADTASWQPVAWGYVGGYDDDQTQVQLPSPVTYDRSTIRAYGLLAVGYPAARAPRDLLEVRVRLRVYTWDGGAGTWSTLVGTSEETILYPVVMTADPADPERAPGLLLGLNRTSSGAGAGQSFHTLRSSWPVASLIPPNGFVDDVGQGIPLGGLTPFEVEYQDGGSADRMVVVEVRGSAATTTGADAPYPGRILVPSCTIQTVPRIA